MNTRLQIKNFRVFDEKGVSIDIKPLTILTGCNSSGKSSIVKAAFLLNSFMKQVNKAAEKGEEIELSKYKLDFTNYPNNLLGRFDKVVSKGSASQKITLGYTVHSGMISKDVDVELTFAADDNDDLNNAYLVCISMSTDEGVFYSSEKGVGNRYNLNIIKKYLPSFVDAKMVVEEFCSLYSLPEFEDTPFGPIGIKKEDFKREDTILRQRIKEIGRSSIMGVVSYLRNHEDSDDLKYTEKQRDLLVWTEKNDSFFNIPVLDYLHTIAKEDIKSVVEKELISDDSKNTFVAEKSVLISASNCVINDFMASSFDNFDAYFRDFEQRFFEQSFDGGENSPCLKTLTINQGYITRHPNGFFGTMTYVSFDEEEERKLRKQREIEEKKPLEQKISEWEARPVSFDLLYCTVMLWNEKFAPGLNEYYKGGAEPFIDFDTPGSFEHHAFNMLSTFVDKLIHEVISFGGFNNMSYVSSSRATVKKLYAMDEKDDFTDLLQRYFRAKQLYSERKSYKRPKYKVNDFLNRWIKQFGLGDSLSFQLDEDGLGVKIRLHKSADDQGRLLSDEGYGITQLISILLQIETAIISAIGENKKGHYSLKCFDQYDNGVFHFEENTIAIEEPEIHLHPSYQSKLAEMFAEAYKLYNIHFMIETHSEYLIRKFQTFVARKEVEADKISLNYVYSPEDYVSPSDSRVKHISINEDGSLSDSFGTGFYDEADNLSVELMSLKMRKS